MKVIGQGHAPGGWIHNDGFETPLKEVTGSFVPPIEPQRVAYTQPLHAGRQVRIECFHQQVEVIFHEHVSVQSPAKARDRFGKQFAKMLIIAAILIDRLALVTACGEVR